MNQICCLNPECHNPPLPEQTKFCTNCGVPLVVLRNRYQPVKPLGGGGFAKTYLAVDIDKLNEKCVVKQLAPQTQGTAGLKKATELFLQEAQQLQQLGEHPQIPALLAYFTENSRLYLVQQFIDGENLLTELENQGIFNESKIRTLLQDLLPVLTVFHNQGIIHRDIKPENIMSRRSDGKFILIDFGASKQLQGTVKTGTSIGTFGYAPLEQMQGGKVYPASDLYSIGVTCFHLLTGVHPWQLWQEDGYKWVKEWRNHLQSPLSSELGQILDQLLQKEAQQRYQSAEKVLQDLNPLPAREVRTPPPNPLPAREVRTPPPNPLPASKEGELKSSCGMDYRKLRDYLAQGKWKEADKETARVMLAVAKREKEGWLDDKSIDNFPCADLRTIDQLWVKYSGGKFGFSVQKRIYQSFGGTRKYNLEIWEKFGDKVGWRKGGYWLYYKDITYDKKAPEGHLPVRPGKARNVGWLWGVGWEVVLSSLCGSGAVFSRVETCKLRWLLLRIINR
ncbi:MULTISPECIES: serine/threonine-protein kinase [Nostocales]|uniref:non-specific serine/threonine protein kinase n=1 Tax=Dolichospermum planctonicum TaxID=136072 RepID=A0A480A8A0_9CYAN|nr:serine/threonine-protein kinase [Anabaena sp. FACHB-1391]MBD2267746.1 GUN4 domain-containing protein [Anabaena sp. FACHB-1391]GCL41300.1 serine/threonine protein kinase [Dolichospermum planctonicum]